MAQLRLIGPPDLVCVDGVVTALGGAKQCGVLSVLALASPQAATTNHLVDGVWGQDPPQTARNTVQVYVSALRKALRPHGADVERSGDGYRFRPGPVQVDIAAFHELVAVGRSALRADDPARAADVLTAALGLWRGAPFAGLDGLAFVDGARAVLEATRARTCADLAQSLIRDRRPDEAVSVARRLIEADPYGERGWALLATAEYHAGRQADALTTCRRVRTVLADELGIDPGPVLVELEQKIRRQTLAAPTSAAPASSRGRSAADRVVPGPPALPALPDPVVGRDALVDSVVEALDGRQRLVTLVGLGGMGKTTVSLAVAHRLRAAGQPVRWCELETAVDAATALELVCRNLGVEPGDDAVQALATSAPGVGGVLVLDNAEQVDGLGAELARLLTHPNAPRLLVSSRRPLQVRREQVLVVPPLEVTGPDGGPGPAVDLFLHRSRRVRVPGDQISAVEAASAVCALLDGIPLAIELAAGRTRVLTPEQLVERIGRRTVSLLDAGREGDLPDRQVSLRAVLEGTVGLLGEPARRLLSFAAACDGWVSIELLEAVAAPDVPDVVDALEELVSVDLVQLDPEGRLRLRPPVREFVAGDDPAAAQRADARVLAEVSATVLARAPMLSGPTSGAALQQLGRDHDTITATLWQGLARAEAGAAAALTLGLNRYWLLTSRWSEARRTIAAVRAVAGHTPADAVRLAILDGTYASYVNAPASRGLLEQSLAAAADLALVPDRLVVNGWCCLAAVTAHQGDPAAAQEYASQAAEAAARSADPSLVALARDLGGHVAAYAGDYERALAATLAGVTDARRSGDRYDLVTLLQNAADSSLRLGRSRDAEVLIDEAFELAGQLDIGALTAQMLLVRGQIAAVMGQPASARGYLTEALRLYRSQYPDPLAVADALTMLACVHDALGGRELAARMWGAADVVYDDQGVSAGDRVMDTFIEQRATAEGDMGPGRVAVLGALGAADPDRLVADVLSRAVVVAQPT